MISLRTLLAAAALAAAAAFPAPSSAATLAMNASQKTVMATVDRFIDGVNNNDARLAIGACAAQTAIVDDFPPHAWQSCSQWLHDFGAANAAGGITHVVATLSTPSRVTIDGTTAYLVAPAKIRYLLHGTPKADSNCTFTVALKRTGGNWHITGWAWSTP